nr:MAG TPA: hypothetical protein [Caudoviricetes sp.]
MAASRRTVRFSSEKQLKPEFSMKSQLYIVYANVSKSMD